MMMRMMMMMMRSGKGGEALSHEGGEEAFTFRRGGAAGARLREGWREEGMDG